MINGILAKVHLIVGSVSPQIHFAFFLIAPEYIIVIHALSKWQNPYIGFLTVIMVEKARWNLLEHFYLGK